MTAGNKGIAQDTETSNSIEVELDLTYASKYIWRGMDTFHDNDGAFHPSVTLTYRDFYVGFWGAFADSSGHSNLLEFDYLFGYNFSAFEEKRYAVDASVNYTYYDYPNSDSKPGRDGIADLQEVSFSASMPNLLPLGSSYLVPAYTGAYMFAGKDTSNKEIDDGWFHIFGLSYDYPIKPLLRNQESQDLSFFSDVTYQNGVLGLEPSWTHSTLGVSTSFELWKNIYLTPAIYHQWTFDENVNEEDELYGAIGIKLGF
jgi:hypothetical protein